MNPTRVVCFLLILLQGILTGILTNTLLFPLIMVVLALLVFKQPLSISLTSRQKIYGLLALSLFFALKMRFFPMEFEGRFSPFPNNYELNHVVAQGLLALQVIIFAVTPHAKEQAGSFYSLRYLFPLLTMTQLLMITDFVSKSNLHRLAGLLGAGLFTLIFFAYIFSVTRANTRIHGSVVRTLACLILLGVSIVAGILFAHYAGPNVSRLDVFFFQLLRPPITPTGTGISERSTLRSVSDTRSANENQVIVRIEADNAPDYLRAYVFDFFDGRNWQSSLDATYRLPDRAPPDYPLDGNYFRLRPINSETLSTMTVWPAASSSSLLTTLRTRGVASELSDLHVDDHYCCKVKRLPLNRPYHLLESARADDVPPEPVRRASYLQIPDSLSPEARSLCLSVLEGAHTTEEKISAVIGYFLSHYTYKIGITIPPGQDALSFFLTQRPPAHCEYFAAAATLMLRLSGVPCRYATGFAIAEKNTAGGYWVARNRDAHAWAEAWDEKRGWVIVEATPPDGQPHSSSFGRLTSLWDVLKFRISLALALVREKGVHVITLAAVALGRLLLFSLPGRAILLGAALWMLSHAIKRFRAKGPVKKTSVEERRYISLLARMDRHTRHHGFIRPHHQTLNQFAAAVRNANPSDAWHTATAHWYETCSKLRFDGTLPTETISVLNELFLSLTQIDREKRPNN